MYRVVGSNHRLPLFPLGARTPFSMTGPRSGRLHGVTAEGSVRVWWQANVSYMELCVCALILHSRGLLVRCVFSVFHFHIGISSWILTLPSVLSGWVRQKSQIPNLYYSFSTQNMFSSQLQVLGMPVDRSGHSHLAPLELFRHPEPTEAWNCVSVCSLIWWRHLWDLSLQILDLTWFDLFLVVITKETNKQFYGNMATETGPAFQQEWHIFWVDDCLYLYWN